MSATCVVCEDDDQETSKNPIFVCEDCGIGVHKLCYGITASSGNVDPWWCSPCNIGQYEAICELCLQNGGALKKTTDEHWVHVTCALFIKGTMFRNKERMEPVNISNVPQENRGKICIFCAKDCGVCCKCTDSNCDLFLHITCGQQNKCLRENTNPKNNKIEFKAYCRQHKPKESSRRISSVFVIETLAAKDHQPDQPYDIIETIDISSDANDESLADNSSNDSKKGVSNAGVVADHFSNANYPEIDDIGANTLKNSNSNHDKIVNDSERIENDASGFGYGLGISEIAISHVTNNNNNLINNTSTINDADESVGANAFWWDYMELNKREKELEAQLRSKDEVITKVKKNYII